MNSEEKNERRSAIESLSLSDFNVSDEYDTVSPEDPLKSAAEKIEALKRGVVFVLSGGAPVGIIGGEEIIKAVSQGRGADTPCGEVASSRIMKVSYNAKMGDLIPMLVKEKPRAVAVMDEDQNFVGYFSPRDYLEALKKAGIIP